MLLGELPRHGAEPPPARRIRRQLEDRLGHGGGVAGRHQDAAAPGGGGQLAALRLRDHRPAAREDARELGGQGEGHGLGALRQKMDVGGVEQLVQARPRAAAAAG